MPYELPQHPFLLPLFIFILTFVALVMGGLVDAEGIEGLEADILGIVGLEGFLAMIIQSPML